MEVTVGMPSGTNRVKEKPFGAGCAIIVLSILDIENQYPDLMQISKKTSFLFLAISQALHSIEEFRFSLWEVFEPARFVSSLISTNLTAGFLVINITIVLFGFWCYFFPVVRSWKSSRVIMWFWVFLELGNSIGHTIFAINAEGYFPGIYTAPLLFLSASFLTIGLIKEGH